MYRGFAVLLILYPLVYCVLNHFCSNFYVSFSLFEGNLFKRGMRRFLSERNTEKYNLRSLWLFVMPVTVRRWHRSAAAEGWWGSLTKFGVTECMMDRCSHDGPSCWFVMRFREVVPVSKFQELKCFGTETLHGPLCLWRSVIPSVEGNEEKQKKLHKYGTTESMTVRRDQDDPSLGLLTQPRFDYFPANRVLI